MLELNKGRIFEGQSDNCLKRKYIDSRSSITKDKRNRSERVPLDNLLPRAKEEGVVVGDEDGLIYISSHKVQRKPESSCEEAGWQTSQWTDQAIRNCFFFSLFPISPYFWAQSVHSSRRFVTIRPVGESIRTTVVPKNNSQVDPQLAPSLKR
jgi:hypothetical protein